MKLPLRFFIQALRSSCSSLPVSMSLSWALPVPGGSLPVQMPFMTQASPLPSVFNFDFQTLNPFIPASIEGANLTPLPPPEAVAVMPPFFFLEFMGFCRGILERFSPFVRGVMSEQTMGEAFFVLEVGSVPVEIATPMVARLAVVTTRRGHGLTPLTGGLGNALRALFSYLSGNTDDALYSIGEFVNVCHSPENQEMVLLSPSFTIPKCCIGACLILLQIGQLDLYDKLFALLTFYARIGYVSAITGIQILERIRTRLYPNLPPLSLGLDFNHTVGDTGLSFLNTVIAPSLERRKEEEEEEEGAGQASSSRQPPTYDVPEGSLDGSGSSSDQGDECSPQSPMDVFYSLFELGNEQKFFSELGFIFKGDEFTDLS